jgi:opacity protein-like surface antigen
MEKVLDIMKITLRTLAAGFVLLVASASVQAQPPTYVPPPTYAPPPPYSPYAQPYYYRPAYTTAGLFYVGGDIGGVIMQDMNVRNANAKMAFDPGMRGDIFFGYQIAPPVAVEIETGAIWNQLRTGSGLFINSIAPQGDLYQIPILANVVFRLPLAYGISAYIGGGVGGVASELDYHDSDNGFFGFHHHVSDTDFTFAYQGMTGVKWAVAPNMEVDLSYKFLGTLDHTWFGGDPVFFTHTDPAYSHSFLVSFTMHF